MAVAAISETFFIIVKKSKIKTVEQTGSIQQNKNDFTEKKNATGTWKPSIPP